MSQEALNYYREQIVKILERLDRVEERVNHLWWEDYDPFAPPSPAARERAVLRVDVEKLEG